MEAWKLKGSPVGGRHGFKIGEAQPEFELSSSFLPPSTTYSSCPPHVLLLPCPRRVSPRLISKPYNLSLTSLLSPTGLSTTLSLSTRSLPPDLNPSQLNQTPPSLHHQQQLLPPPQQPSHPGHQHLNPQLPRSTLPPSAPTLLRWRESSLEERWIEGREGQEEGTT